MSRFAPIASSNNKAVNLDPSYKFGFHTSTDKYAFKSGKGLSVKVVEDISSRKDEPEWMRKKRLAGHQIFKAKKMPEWGADLSAINFNDIYYYLKPTNKEGKKWEDVPLEIKKTFDKLGIPEAEQKTLSGVKAQFDSEVVYGSIKKMLTDKGVVFLGMDEGLRKYPDLVKEYFSSLIPSGDNKFAALNTAVWSGGSFVYVPKNVDVGLPLQAYFRINSPNAGQFERTLIIADEGSKVHYVEGCTAPAFSDGSLHSAVVEIFVKKGATVQYTTVQNWYKNVYNLVTKRARVEEEGRMTWTDFNMGCLTADTKILVKNKGLKNIKDVKPGDIVFSADLYQLQPVAARVTAAKKTGIREVYQLKTENARFIKATDNHPFLTIVKEAAINYTTLSWKQLKDIRVGDRVGIVRGFPDDGLPQNIDFQYKKKGRAKFTKYNPTIPKETSEELMWLFGVYQGDGYCEKGRNGSWSRVYFAVPPRDRARNKLEQIIKNLFNVAFRPKGICVTVPSVILSHFIKHMGFGGRANEKRVPDWIYELPRRQKLAFIEGYLDSDGSIVHRKEKNGILYGQIVFASVNKLLLEDMKMLMIGAGLNPLNIATYTKFRNLYKGRWKNYTCHFLTMNIRGNLQQIRDKLNTNSVIEFVRVREIEKQNVEDVYDLEIEGMHNFIANGIIVHNSRITMKYPSFILAGKGASGETLSMAMAGAGQQLDTGSKAIHLAPYTSSTIISKSISGGGGRTSYRGMVNIGPKAHHAKSKIVCDALILDPKSRSDTYPTNKIFNSDVTLEHEASVSRIGEEQLFYLMSRGISENEAGKMIVQGFADPLVKKLPMEYAVEMNRLIDMEMTGSVG